MTRPICPNCGGHDGPTCWCSWRAQHGRTKRRTPTPILPLSAAPEVPVTNTEPPIVWNFKHVGGIATSTRARRADALQEAFGDRTSGGVLRVTVWRTQDGVPVRGGVQVIDVAVDMRPVVTVIERTTADGELEVSGE